MDMNYFFDKRPEMLKKYNYPNTINKYFDDFNKNINNNKSFRLKKLIINEIDKLLPDKICKNKFGEQIDNYPVISYADHHGILNYKLLYNSNILFNNYNMIFNLPFIVVLATGNIPLLNISHPRGFYFKKNKFNLFSAKESRKTVFILNNKIKANKNKGIDSIAVSYQKDSLTVEERKYLNHLFFDCIKLDEVCERYDKFSDQVTYINYKLWKYFFSDILRKKIPNIIYLQSNNIINNYIIKDIENNESLIYKIIFDKRIRKKYINNFLNISGCWGDQHGSYLFWVVSNDGKYKRLDFNDDYLYNKDIKIELKENDIKELIISKKIIPTLFFDFLIITFLEGYTALGGFNQIEYLTAMKKAHVKTLKEIGMPEMADLFASRITDGLICGMMPLKFDSAIDMIWEHNSINGKFNGNLDNGLTEFDLQKISNMRVKDMIHAGIETMLGIVK